MTYLSIGIILLFLIIVGAYLVFIVIIDKKIKLYEKKIIFFFNKRNNLIPSLHDVTKTYINKHSEVFGEILKLRKYSLNNSDIDFILTIRNEVKIHKELNFIFKLVNHNNKIQKNEKYLLLQDLFIDYSKDIGENIGNYKKIVNDFNRLLIFKNFTIIGLFVNIDYKKEI